MPELFTGTCSDPSVDVIQPNQCEIKVILKSDNVKLRYLVINDYEYIESQCLTHEDGTYTFHTFSPLKNDSIYVKIVARTDTQNAPFKLTLIIKKGTQQFILRNNPANDYYEGVLQHTTSIINYEKKFVFDANGIHENIVHDVNA